MDLSIFKGDKNGKFTVKSTPSATIEEVYSIAIAELLIEKGVIERGEYNCKLDEVNERVCPPEIRYNLKHL